MKYKKIAAGIIICLIIAGLLSINFDDFKKKPIMKYEVVTLNTEYYNDIPVNTTNGVWSEPGQLHRLNEDLKTEIEMAVIKGGHEDAQDDIINKFSIDINKKLGIVTEEGSTKKNNFTTGGEYNSGFYADYAHFANYKVTTGYTYPIYSDRSFGQPEFFILVELGHLWSDMKKELSYQPVQEEESTIDHSKNE